MVRRIGKKCRLISLSLGLSLFTPTARADLPPLPPTPTPATAAHAETEPEGRLLFDFRQPFRVRRHGHPFEEAAVRAARGRPGLNDCAIEVKGTIDGAFTAKGVGETAFVVDCVYPPDATPQLVIMDETGKVVRNQPIPGWLLRGKTDLEGDGVEELVVSRTASEAHSDHEEAFLVNAQRSWAYVTGLGEPWWEDCGEQASGTTVLAVALYVHEANGKRSVERRNFRAACVDVRSNLPQENLAPSPFGPPETREIPDPLSAKETPDVPGARKLTPADDALSWQLLYDFRAGWPRSAGNQAPLPIAQRILAKAKMPAAEVHSVHGGVEGAFRAPGLVETAYVVYVITPGPRGCHENRLFLLGERDALSGPYGVPGDWIMRVVDVDNDGVDELVMVDSDGAFTGVTTETGSLVSLREGRVASDDLGAVDEDACGLMGEQRDAVVFVANEGLAHRFRIQLYTGFCPIRDFGYGSFVQVSSRATAPSR